jgi:hypothetical protein
MRRWIDRLSPAMQQQEVYRREDFWSEFLS